MEHIMRTCSKCNVKVKDPSLVCPLCKGVLSSPSGEETPLAFPPVGIDIKKFHMLKRVFIFLSIIASVGSIAANFLVYDGFLWSILTVAGIIYLWIVIPYTVANHINIVSKILAQVFWGSLFVVLIDFIVGYRGWSVEYVIPSVFSAADIAVIVVILINRMNWRNYLLYQFVIGFLGFAPLVLYLLSIAENPVFVIISTSVSALCLIGTAVFGDKTVKSEFKRRLHF